MEIFNKIFEVCEIKIKGKTYKLKFTLSAVLWLEQKGIKIETLSVNLTKYPKTTIFMLAYAGLPTEEFRDKLSFEEFIRSLNDNEQLNIVKKLDLLLTAYYKDLAIKIEKARKQMPVENKQDPSVIKKKLFELIRYVCCKYNKTITEIGNLTILEITELAKIKQAQERKDLGTLNLMMLSNIRNGAILSITTKQAQREAKRNAKELIEEYKKMIDINNDEENNIDPGGFLK